MSLGQFSVPSPVNEPAFGYEPGTLARTALEAELRRQAQTYREVTPIIGGQRGATTPITPITMPHAHGRRLGGWSGATPDDVKRAIEAALAAKPSWMALPWEERAAVFLRAANLLRGKYRDRLNAATMLGQSKTAHQAEIDSACELIDFFTFNVHFLGRIMAEQPHSPVGQWNRMEARPLDGFVFAVSPFNFTAIAGNLPTAPALCGNTVVWKPASTAIWSGAVVMELLEEAGLPPGVINFVPGPAAEISSVVLASEHFGGVHFTGSTDVFQSLWHTIGSNLRQYRQYPRIVGETGGKDFVFAHGSADLDALVVALLRGAFEYQGQKCSAASRAYIPSDLWPVVRERLGDLLPQIRVGDVADLRNFMGAVIDKRSFTKLRDAIGEAKARVGQGVGEVLGGFCDDREGWFIHPTVIVAEDPHYRTMQEELFGPVLTIHVYPEREYIETLELCEASSRYALTGAIFARDRYAITQAAERLRFAAGNFYVNDKPTGAVVGQQPFGGSRASGTNDKAGSLWNLGRWISPRTIKENFMPPTEWRYPFMG